MIFLKCSARQKKIMPCSTHFLIFNITKKNFNHNHNSYLDNFKNNRLIYFLRFCKKFKKQPLFFFEMAERFGHVGFIDFNAIRVYWYETRAADFITTDQGPDGFMAESSSDRYQ